MVNEEVENILSEIRERVRARELPVPKHANPEHEVAEPLNVSREGIGNSATEHIVESYLTTTARAWDRLPPIMSNRSGAIANCELWLKRQIKRMTHWFTWEQVNYNAAVHHALLSTLQAINHNEQFSARRLAETREEIQRAIAEQVGAVQELKVQLEALGQALRQEASQGLSQQQSQLEEQRASQVAAQRKEVDARLLALTEELNARFEQLLAEQRVCFKQLSLEATEEAVLEDRARRKNEKVIEELSRRIKELEK